MTMGSDGQAPRLQLATRLLGTIGGLSLTFEPAPELREPGVEIHGRLVADDPASSRNVRVAVANVPHAVASGDLAAEIGPSEDLGDAAGDLRDGARAAAADVQDVSWCVVALEGEPAGAGHVMDADEVALLLAVLEDQGRPAVQDAGGEDGEHAGVGVLERLPRPIGVEEAQRDRGDAVGAPRDQAKPLLVVLAQRVHG